MVDVFSKDITSPFTGNPHRREPLIFAMLFTGKVWNDVIQEPFEHLEETRDLIEIDIRNKEKYASWYLLLDPSFIFEINFKIIHGKDWIQNYSWPEAQRYLE